MVMMNKIFTVIFIMCTACVAPAFAASNGCENENNNLINPVLALCSTHSYNAATQTNVGKNFSSDTDRQNQRDIIALKTTVITQQMKQQYDYLNATIRRLKTQLQKAVLTTSLEAAGASSDKSGSSSYNSNNRNIILAGAQDCTAQTSVATATDCLQSNIVQIRAAANANELSGAMKQLQKDLTAADNWGIKVSSSDCDAIANNTRNRDNLLDCISALNVAIAKFKEDRSDATAQVNAIKGLFRGN